MEEKRKTPVLTIIFYVLAAIMLLYTFYAASISIAEIKEAMKQGISLAKGYKQIVQYFATNTLNYLFYSIAYFFFGYSINLHSRKK